MSPRSRIAARPIHVDAVPVARRAARAKEWFKAALGVALVSGVLRFILSDPDGLAWEVLRAAVGVVVAATFALWAVMAFRAAGGARTWLGPFATATGLTAALFLLAWLVA